MPITFCYDSENNTLLEKGEGTISMDEFLSYREELSKAGLRSGVRCLADYRNAVVNFTYAEMRTTIEKNKRAIGDLKDVKVAICTQDDLGYGMARMYGSINETAAYIVKVFRSIEEARDWLGITTCQ